jgi:glucose/arabinose dehydrogenase
VNPVRVFSLFPFALLTTALFAAPIVPACSGPGETPADEDSDQGELNYATNGTCDGLPRLTNIETPPGVCVGVVATGFTFARGIAQLPSGDFILAEMGGWAQDRGAVWLLKRNADKSYAKTRLLAQIDKPSGVAIGPDGLPYVGTPANIFRFDPYKIDPRLHQPRLSLVVKDLPGDGRHPLKRFVFDKNDPWTLYVNVGSASDVCEQGASAKPPSGFPFPCAEAEGDGARGGIRKYDLSAGDHVGGPFTMIAHGLRNSMALAVHPTSNVLIQGENSRDAINKQDVSLSAQEGELPHEELNVIEEGQSYGWPYCIDTGVPNPEYRGRVDCANYRNPALVLPGHVSPLGMAYYTGDLFPAAYKNQLLVTYHGYREYGHRLVLVPVDDRGVPGLGDPLDILRGWEKTDKGPQGAPVDVLVAKDGSIYVTEDKNGTVLRVFFDPTKGDGAPMHPVPPKRPVVSPDEQARCDALAQKNDLFSIVEKSVFDRSCLTCHGSGPGYAGDLALIRCDAEGNAKRLLEPRRGNRGPLVRPRDENSELVKRLKGDGFPQMPAGGVDQEQLDALLEWIRAGAPAP